MPSNVMLLCVAKHVVMAVSILQPSSTPAVCSRSVLMCCRVTEKGNYSEKDASDLIRQVLEGVAYLHSQGKRWPLTSPPKPVSNMACYLRLMHSSPIA